MKKTLLRIVLGIALCLLCLQASALAAEYTVYIGGTELTVASNGNAAYLKNGG